MIAHFGIRMALALLPQTDAPPPPPVAILEPAVATNPADDPAYHARLDAQLCEIKYWTCPDYKP